MPIHPPTRGRLDCDDGTELLALLGRPVVRVGQRGQLPQGPVIQKGPGLPDGAATAARAPHSKSPLAEWCILGSAKGLVEEG